MTTVKMTRDFCSGYAAATADVGREGDARRADWSAPHEYLKERLNTFEPLGEGLIERLRYRGGLCSEAADRIERLEATLVLIADKDKTPLYRVNDEAGTSEQAGWAYGQFAGIANGALMNGEGREA
jgi:hypothetical protein